MLAVVGDTPGVHSGGMPIVMDTLGAHCGECPRDPEWQIGKGCGERGPCLLYNRRPQGPSLNKVITRKPHPLTWQLPASATATSSAWNPRPRLLRGLWV
jgi:hypothetical protein